MITAEFSLIFKDFSLISFFNKKICNINLVSGGGDIAITKKERK
jgi:hypothetical protein